MTETKVKETAVKTEKPAAKGGNIFKRITSIMKEIEAISKDRENPQQRYKFRGIDDVYNMVHKLFAKHGVFTVPTVVDEKHEDRETKDGKIVISRIYNIKYTFYAEDGSSFEAIVPGEGMDYGGDKSANKAMSAAHKYLLLQVFCIPTEEEKDSEYESPQAGKKKSSTQSKSESNGEKKGVYISILKNGEYVDTPLKKVFDLFAIAKRTIGSKDYYAILEKYGYEHANKIPYKMMNQVYHALKDRYKEVIEEVKKLTAEADAEKAKADAIAEEEAQAKDVDEAMEEAAKKYEGNKPSDGIPF